MVINTNYIILLNQCQIHDCWKLYDQEVENVEYLE